jgi:hypothetical protein
MLDPDPNGSQCGSAILLFISYQYCFSLLGVMQAKSTEQEGEWAEKFFIPVCCFLLFNIGDYVGRYEETFLTSYWLMMELSHAYS